MGGLRHVTGFPDRPPVRAGISIGDTLASLYATIGAMIALHHLKVNGGSGHYVDVTPLFAIARSLPAIVGHAVPGQLIAAAPSDRRYPAPDWLASGEQSSLTTLGCAA